MVRFTLTDAESDSAQVLLSFRLPDGTVRPLSARALSGASNPGTFEATPTGKLHQVEWDYILEQELPTDGSFTQGVGILARLAGREPIDSTSPIKGLGNDPPEIVRIARIAEPGEEVSAIVAVPFTVADSSGDIVDIKVEFRELGTPQTVWLPARPAATRSSPAFAFKGIVAAPLAETGPKNTIERRIAGPVPPPLGGTRLIFFWDTDADLFQGDKNVQLRFTARDGFEEGSEELLSMESRIFRVDNNGVPTVSIRKGELLVNPDDRSGIPIPYEIRDLEGDSVQVVFQWRRAGGAPFPPLPEDPAEIQAILKDPVLREENGIATEFPTFVGGRTIPAGADSIRLPELAKGTAAVFSNQLVGCQLEILRASSIPEPVVWSSNPLQAPVAALPIEDGLNALVLDTRGRSSSAKESQRSIPSRTLIWQVRELELATGRVKNDLVSGLGVPTAMALGSQERFLFVASRGGEWRVDRFELANGVASPMGSVTGPFIAPEGIRAIATLSAHTALVTVDDALLLLDYSQSQVKCESLLTGLATPWGLAPDPLLPNHIYLALGGEDRIVEVDLNTLQQREIPAVPSQGALAFPNPRAIALERSGARLLVVVAAPGVGNGARLRGLRLRSTLPRAQCSSGAVLADPTVFPIGGPLPDESSSIAAGPVGLRLLAFPSTNELAAGAGIEQRRLITAYEPARQEATVTTPFAPPVGLAKDWRISSVSCPPFEFPGTRSFVWDSRDMGTGQVFLRAVPFDSERGQLDETSIPTMVAPRWDRVQRLTDPASPSGLKSVVAADFDGDGDIDLAYTNRESDTLTVFYQHYPNGFGAPGLVLGGPQSRVEGPASIAAGDFDGDGLLDLVSANRDSDNLTVFIERVPGREFLAPGVPRFPSTNSTANCYLNRPVVLGGPGVLSKPMSVVAADLDGDGILDVVSANFQGNDLTIFFQRSPGDFDQRNPLRLGGGNSTLGPLALATADLDGDGDLDIVSANQNSNNLTIFFQQGPRNFVPAAWDLGGPGITDRPQAVATADLDGDGDLDIISANDPTNMKGSLTIFYQDAPGNFRPNALVVGDTSAINGAQSILAADLDDDGDIDLVTGSTLNLVVFFQIAPGVFSPIPEALGGLGTIDNPASIAAIDIDFDGDLDLISANTIGAPLTILFQNDPGTFNGNPTRLGEIEILKEPRSLAVGDLDSDGDLDIVSANGGTTAGNLAIFFQSGPGVFDVVPVPLFESAALRSAPRTSFEAITGENAAGITRPEFVATSDLDGDGDTDIVSAWDDNTLKIFVQTSPGVFDQLPDLGSSTTTLKPVALATADLDGDGAIDIISANSGSNDLRLFYQDPNAPGVFKEAQDALANQGLISSPVSVAVADLDGNGSFDIISANESSSNLTIFFQGAPRSFSPTPYVLTSSATLLPTSIAVADLDGDGDLDVVSANKGIPAFNLPATLTIFWQTTPGNFGGSPLVLMTPNSQGSQVISQPTSVAAGDFDGDGDLDLVCTDTGAGANNLMVFLQGDPGVFHCAPNASLGGLGKTRNPDSVAAVDLDGDGDIDLLSANAGNEDITTNNITVFWNQD